ncbi:hypothetical protein IG631_23306 [Alternaria alternata]|nr:hypothetical protein IG631_23306 [Alternaria alternata]
MSKSSPATTTILLLGTCGASQEQDLEKNGTDSAKADSTGTDSAGTGPEEIELEETYPELPDSDESEPEGLTSYDWSPWIRTLVTESGSGDNSDTGAILEARPCSPLQPCNSCNNTINNPNLPTLLLTQLLHTSLPNHLIHPRHPRTAQTNRPHTALLQQPLDSILHAFPDLLSRRIMQIRSIKTRRLNACKPLSCIRTRAEKSNRSIGQNLFPDLARTDDTCSRGYSKVRSSVSHAMLHSASHERLQKSRTKFLLWVDELQTRSNTRFKDTSDGLPRAPDSWLFLQERHKRMLTITRDQEPIMFLQLPSQRRETVLHALSRVVFIVDALGPRRRGEAGSQGLGRCSTATAKSDLRGDCIERAQYGLDVFADLDAFHWPLLDCLDIGRVQSLWCATVLQVRRAEMLLCGTGMTTFEAVSID